MKVDSLIDISSNNISYRINTRGKIIVKCKLRVETELIPSKDERYFLIVLEAKEDEDIDNFSELGEKVKSIALRINPSSTIINTIWNDVGRHYAQSAYPVINEIENLMRKLISKFMLINAGMNWSKDAIHPELFKKIEGYSEEELYSNDLYKLDFIHLSDVLFKKKRDISLEHLDRLLLKTKFNESDKELILKYAPKSNWEKYFSTLLNEDGKKLEDKWQRLYKLRNKVAHNRFITKVEYNEIIGVCSHINKTLTDAMNKLGEIDLDVEERESIVLSYQSQSPAAIGYLAEKSIAEYYINNGFTTEQLNSIHTRSPLDFIAIKENQKIGVVAKSISVRNIYPSLKMFLHGHPHRNHGMNMLERFDYSNYNSVIIIYALRDIDQYGISERMIHRIKEMEEELDSRVSLKFGLINDEQTFELIEF